MTTMIARPAPGSTAPSWRLPRAAAFYLQASIVVVLLAGSSAPTPLYALYQAEWGFSPITTTVVFGVYALAVLASLLTVGSLSDHIGRRPVLLVALGVQAVTMLIFATADGVPILVLARVLQGLSTGAAVGAVGAGMLDLDQARGTIANAVSAPIGTASGSLLAGVLVEYLPAPVHLVYLVLFVVFIVQAIGVALMAESSSVRPGALASLRVQFALPAKARRPMLLAAPALIAAWSLAGLYGALGPTLVRLMVGHNSFVLGGLSLFVLAGSGAAAVLVLRTAAPRTAMIIGTATLIVGLVLTILAINDLSTGLFFLGTAVAGVGLRRRLPGRDPQRRPDRGGPRAGRGAVDPLRRVLPGHGPARGDRRGAGRARGRVSSPRRGNTAVAVIVLAALALLGALRPSPAPVV